MSIRGIALFLVFVLLWSALSTLEAPQAFAQPLPAQQQDVAHAGGAVDVTAGSVEHHHLDDLPLQAQSDTPTDTLGLMPTRLRHSEPPLLMAQPPALSAAATGPPFLAGPLRPPCGTAHAG